MSLKDFKPVEQVLQLKSPKDGELLPIFLKVVGPDSKQVRAIERQLQKEGIARGKAGTDVEIEEIEAILIRKFAAAVIGWDEAYDEDMGGAYSEAFLLSLFQDPDYRWVVDQVAAYASERQNFFR